MFQGAFVGQKDCASTGPEQTVGKNHRFVVPGIPIRAQRLGSHDKSVQILVRLKQVSDEIDGNKAGATPHSGEVKDFNVLPHSVMIDYPGG